MTTIADTQRGARQPSNNSKRVVGQRLLEIGAHILNFNSTDDSRRTLVFSSSPEIDYTWQDTGSLELNAENTGTRVGDRHQESVRAQRT